LKAVESAIGCTVPAETSNIWTGSPNNDPV